MAEAKVEKLVLGPLSTNCYLVSFKEDAFIIDPAFEWQKILAYVEERKLKVKFIINTHTHIDHIAYEDKLGFEVIVHSREKDFLKDPQKNLSSFLSLPLAVEPKTLQAVEGGEKIKFGESFLEIIPTPGHSPGGISILLDNFLFSGDTLFYAAVGRTDIPNADANLLRESVEKLFKLDEDIIVFPGHGPQTTIGKEKENKLLDLLV